MPDTRVATCTGIGATWCPVHGDCTCPTFDDGEIKWHYVGGHVLLHGFRMWSATAQVVVEHDPACPLHAVGSAHGC